MSIEELRRLEQAATPAPWAVATDRQGDYLVAHHEAAVCDLLDSTLAARQDARLITAARNALPALLRVAEIAQEVRAALYLNGVDTEAMRESLEGIEERLAAALRALEATR